MSKVFCTVNVDTSDLTSITAKSILKFHPAAKIFIVDAYAKDSNRKFQPADSSIAKSIEVISGISPGEVAGIRVNLHDTDLAPDEIDLAKQKLKCEGEACVNCAGDFNHTLNIQLAIDVLKQNFILIDSDAPLIQPADFDDPSVLTACKISTHLYSTVLGKGYTRFVPFIQWMNVGMMSQLGIKYCSKDMLKYNVRNAVARGGPGLMLFPTGTWMYKQASDLRAPFKQINCYSYIDHFNHGSSPLNISVQQCREEFVAKWKRELGMA